MKNYENNLTVRECLQKIGTDCFRNLQQDVWVNYLLKTIKKFQSDPYNKYSPEKGIYKNNDVFDFLGKNENIVIPDGRFINEIEILRQHKAYIIRIVKDSSGLSDEKGNHLSETEQNSIPDNKFDDIIENNGSLEDLYIKADRIIEKYKFLQNY